MVTREPKQRGASESGKPDKLEGNGLTKLKRLKVRRNFGASMGELNKLIIKEQKMCMVYACVGLTARSPTGRGLNGCVPGTPTFFYTVFSIFLTIAFPLFI